MKLLAVENLNQNLYNITLLHTPTIILKKIIEDRKRRRQCRYREFKNFKNSDVPADKSTTEKKSCLDQRNFQTTYRREIAVGHNFFFLFVIFAETDEGEIDRHEKKRDVIGVAYDRDRCNRGEIVLSKAISFIPLSYIYTNR